MGRACVTDMAKAHQLANFGTLGHIAKNKLANDNDIKIIIQGANSQTGIGKTTLAIELCRYIDQSEEGWNAEDKAFVDVQEYVQAHLDYSKGSALLLDEIEAGADSRRSMSQDNVDLSQAWATLRARNIATVATLPSISMLDNRMLELADYWILVKERGLAQPFEINVNDFAPHRAPQRKPMANDEHIQFPDLPDRDKDKTYLDKIKDDMLRGNGKGYIPKSECENKVRDEREEAEREIRNKLLADVYHQIDAATYEDLSNLESIDLSRQHINRIVKNQVPS